MTDTTPSAETASPALQPRPAISVPADIFDLMLKTIRFYADSANFIDTPPWEDGDLDLTTPLAVPVLRSADMPPICDCGDTARDAIKAITAVGLSN